MHRLNTHAIEHGLPSNLQLNYKGRVFVTFINTFLVVYDDKIPLRKCNSGKSKNTPRMPWITNSMLKSINKKKNYIINIKPVNLHPFTENIPPIGMFSQRFFVLLRKNIILLSFRQLSTILRERGK